MQDNSASAAKDIAYLVMYPEGLEITDELFGSLITAGNSQFVNISKDDHLFYTPEDDEFTYSWKMPGIKLMFKNKVSYDKAKEIADDVVAKLAAHSGLNIELVLIDIARLMKDQ